MGDHTALFDESDNFNEIDIAPESNEWCKYMNLQGSRVSTAPLNSDPSKWTRVGETFGISYKSCSIACKMLPPSAYYKTSIRWC